MDDPKIENGAIIKELESYMAGNACCDTAPFHRLFFDLCLESDADKFLELGVFHGNSSVVFALAAKAVGGMAYGIDCVDCEGAVDRIDRMGLGRYWMFIHANSWAGDDVLEFAGLKKQPQFGFVFFDASKQYDATKKEIAAYAPLVVPGGYMAFHDGYMFEKYRPEVHRPVDDFLSKNKDFELVKDYTVSHGLKLVKRLGEAQERL